MFPPMNCLSDRLCNHENSLQVKCAIINQWEQYDDGSDQSGAGDGRGDPNSAAFIEFLTGARAGWAREAARGQRWDPAAV